LAIRRLIKYGFYVLFALFIGKSVAFSQTHRPVKVSYEPSEQFLLNPERGFYRQFTARSGGRPLSLSELKELRDAKMSLLLRMYYLDQFRDRDLSDQQLRLVESDLNTIRRSGCKCILRFAYSSNLGESDAPLDKVLWHIEQLQPVLLANADVIAVVQAGFVGAWGEWHGSTNNLEIENAVRSIAGQLLDALPESRCIQVRTPRYKRMILGNDSVLTSKTAFMGTPQSRIGHHNDCFLADDNDLGTYESQRLLQDRLYVVEDTRYVPMGGETCAVSPFTKYDHARSELSKLHFTYLNRGFHPRVLAEWRENGLYAEAEKHLGYRLSLISSTCDPEAQPGGVWNVNLEFQNQGWAAPINPRDVVLLFKSETHSLTYQVKLPVDLRRWLPGQPISLNFAIGLPETMKLGEYNLSLRLSDPEERLEDRVEYAIQLANKGLWDSLTGLHDLNQRVVITLAKPSEEYKGKLRFHEVNPN
jgi:hypothetical protein